MSKPSIVCVVPSIRPESMTEFRKAWAPLFEKHGVVLFTIWDGEEPGLQSSDNDVIVKIASGKSDLADLVEGCKDLFCRRTDAVRNYGFVAAAKAGFDYILTLDDDVHPPASSDPIQEHLDVLQRRVPISWMNTAMPDERHPLMSEDGGVRSNLADPIYLRGFPYGIRDEAPVKVSHGVWVNVPDFDGRTQLELGKCGTCDGSGIDPNTPVSQFPNDPNRCSKCNGTGYDGSRLPYSLPYFRGPIPKGVYAPICGMSLMVHRDALPYLYFAPMGPDSGVSTECPKCEGTGASNGRKDADTELDLECLHCNGTGETTGLNRFADIWMGILLKRAMDANGWAIYTGASTVIHTRASDPFKNVEQEKLGIEWNEWAWKMFTQQAETVNASPEFITYWKSYLDKANRFRKLIRELQGAK